MVWLTVSVAAIGAGFVAAITGFGSGIVLMMVLPYFFDMVIAPAYSSAICMGLTGVLAWSYRKYFDWRTSALPFSLFVISGVVALNFVQGLDLRNLTLLFGIFLLFLAAFFFLFSNKLHVEANWKTALVCSTISGVASAMFGIGGPLMAVYYTAASKSKESYIANMQWMFLCSSSMNTLTRLVKGIYTVDMIPISLVGLALALVGKEAGRRVFDRLDGEAIRKLVYIFVAISGVIKVVQYFV